MVSQLRLDLTLMLAGIFLAVVSLVTLYSAGGANMALIYRQATHLLLAFLVMLACANLDLHFYRKTGTWLYIGAIMLLVWVLFQGGDAQSVSRWLAIGPFRFQPSEFMKPVLLIFLCGWLTRHPETLRLTELMATVLFVGLPFYLVMRQPDLGTALIIAMAGSVALVLRGLSWRQMTVAVAAILFSLPAVWLFVLKEYQKNRILFFLSPEKDPLNAGYHVIQSKIAIGSGGLHGKGWLQGTQSHLEFLPEQTTDFIFSVFAEEFGFTGVVVLLAAYVVIILRGLYLSAASRHLYGRVLGAACVFILAVSAYVNISMTAGLLPVVGLPLPLMSMGGSSLVSTGILLGVIHSLSVRSESGGKW